MTRKEGGLTRYFTGKPCKRGHVAERHMSDGNCVKCKRERDAGPEAKAKRRERQATPEYKAGQRESDVNRRYGITLEQFDAVLNIQNQRCACCNKPLGGGTPSVDHCHESGQVRGILCRSCNTALGKLNDSIPALESLIRYLREAEHYKADGGRFKVLLDAFS